MSDHQNDIELIERFFRQELSEEELFDFETRVRQDPSFSKEVILMRDIYYGVKWSARNDLKDDLKEIQKEALSEGAKAYKPRIRNWLKWFSWFTIIAIIAGVGYFYFDKHRIETFKSMLFTKDSTLIYDTIRNATPGSVAPGPMIIKDPSDTMYNEMEADFKLQVKDPSTFEIKKIGTSENGMTNYEITADGQTQMVQSQNPNLTEELLKKKEENLKPEAGEDRVINEDAFDSSSISEIQSKKRLFPRLRKKRN